MSATTKGNTDRIAMKKAPRDMRGAQRSQSQYVFFRSQAPPLLLIYLALLQVAQVNVPRTNHRIEERRPLPGGANNSWTKAEQSNRTHRAFFRPSVRREATMEIISLNYTERRCWRMISTAPGNYQPESVYRASLSLSARKDKSGIECA